MAEGLERVPTRELEGTSFQEFDLDAALARKPALILVDEFAHTNAPGSRQTKRWQDVQELIQAGIDVWTTVNVQHLERFGQADGGGASRRAHRGACGKCAPSQAYGNG